MTPVPRPLPHPVRRSVAVTSNIHPSGFDERMPKTLATATVGCSTTPTSS